MFGLYNHAAYQRAIEAQAGGAADPHAVLCALWKELTARNESVGELLDQHFGERTWSNAERDVCLSVLAFLAALPLERLTKAVLLQAAQEFAENPEKARHAEFIVIGELALPLLWNLGADLSVLQSWHADMDPAVIDRGKDFVLMVFRAALRSLGSA